MADDQENGEANPASLSLIPTETLSSILPAIPSEIQPAISSAMELTSPQAIHPEIQHAIPSAFQLAIQSKNLSSILPAIQLEIEPAISSAFQPVIQTANLPSILPAIPSKIQPGISSASPQAILPEIQPVIQHAIPPAIHSVNQDNSEDFLEAMLLGSLRFIVPDLENSTLDDEAINSRLRQLRAIITTSGKFIRYEHVATLIPILIAGCNDPAREADALSCLTKLVSCCYDLLGALKGDVLLLMAAKCDKLDLHQKVKSWLCVLHGQAEYVDCIHEYIADNSVIFLLSVVGHPCSEASGWTYLPVFKEIDRAVTEIDTVKLKADFLVLGDPEESYLIDLIIVFLLGSLGDDKFSELSSHFSVRLLVLQPGVWRNHLHVNWTKQFFEGSSKKKFGALTFVGELLLMYSCDRVPDLWSIIVGNFHHAFQLAKHGDENAIKIVGKIIALEPWEALQRKSRLGLLKELAEKSESMNRSLRSQIKEHIIVPLLKIEARDSRRMSPSDAQIWNDIDVAIMNYL